MSLHDGDCLLDVSHLSVCFGKRKRRFEAVKDVSFQINRGETFGLVGESGSGKTTIGRSIMRIYTPSSGEIRYEGKRISGKIDKALDKAITRQIQMIFQDPISSLNERAKVDYIVSEGILNDYGINRQVRRKMIDEALENVGLQSEYASRFPHEFSGGQRQRIGIARAMIMQPSLIIADEPVSALDVSIRAQVLNLMRKLQREKKLTYLFISHDLSVMRYICDRIAVIHKGQLVEMADTETLFAKPLHPYTQALISAIPIPDPRIERNKVLISYDDSMHHYEINQPDWIEITDGHYVLANHEEMLRYRSVLEGN